MSRKALNLWQQKPGEVMDVTRLIRRTLASVVVLALLIGGGGMWWALRGQALASIQDEARTLLVTATAIRSYTSQDVLPHLERNGEFQPASIPSFAAQSVFSRVTDDQARYSYREPTLNPTNPMDRPTEFEAGLIRSFRADTDLTEQFGLHLQDGTQLAYLARPIKIRDESCLSCHSTPEAAPVAMVNRYGRANGFGWEMGETVGIQLLIVPADRELQNTNELVLILLAGLTALFALTYFALSSALQSNVVEPLKALSKRAEEASLGLDSGAKEDDSGSEEIRSLSIAIRRLAISMKRALERLQPGMDNQTGDDT
jgi:hypothetical protein